MEYRLVVAGSRDFINYSVMESTLDQLLSDLVAQEYKIIIRSGAARGADSLGERYAKAKGYRIERFPADWDRFGKSAGYKRNSQMTDGADGCVVYMLKSGTKGSQHMIDTAKKKELTTVVVLYDNILNSYSVHQ